MFRRLILLNLVLAASLVSGVIRLRRDMNSFSAVHRVDQIQPESDKARPKPVDSSSSPPKQEWPDIAAHNPFSFDRNDVPIVVATAAPQQPKRPKPLLFGTIMLGKDHLAMLGPGDSSTRSSRPVHAGEVFDGWTVVAIQDKTVDVKWDVIQETLVMNDPTALRVYEKTAGSTASSQGPVVPVGQVAPPITANPPVASQNPPGPQTPSTGTRMMYTPFGPKPINN